MRSETPLFLKARRLISNQLRAYVVMNILFYGLVVVGMTVSALYPAVQQKLTAALQEQLKHGFMLWVTYAYQSGNIPLASLVTLLVNSFLGAFMMITAPSLIVPFSGFLVGIWRPLLWGLLFYPKTPKMLVVLLPHYLTVLLEGQGYILTLFGAYLLAKWSLFPKRSGYATHGQGYVAGLRANLSLYPLIFAVLAVSAVYEAIEVILAARAR